MDPVSLGLGIAPLCVGALKGAKHARSKIKLMKNHGREVARFRKRLRTQMSIFQDESELLLRHAGVDTGLAGEMLADYGHGSWQGQDLDVRLKSFLGRKYDDVKQVAEDIRDQVAGFDDELSKLGNSDESSGHGKLAVTAQRARSAVGVALHKSSLDEGIESLTDSVTEFRRLRRTARDLHQPVAVAARPHTAMPQEFCLVAKHSSSFLETLSRSWSCLTSSGEHVTHTAKLFLDTDASDRCVNFRMILQYEAISGSLSQQSWLFLRIRSEELSWVDVGLAAPTTNTPEPSTTPSLTTAERPAKARRVKFADSPSTASARCHLADPESHIPRVYQARNLCQSQDVCQHVFQGGRSVHQSRQEGCIGYLESTENFTRLTHQLMAAHDRESTAIQTRSCSPSGLDSIIHPSKEPGIAVHEQLRLALRLARSVLQYHATPWWRRSWKLSDLSYFNTETELSASLATLHIGAKLGSNTRDPMTLETLAADVPTPPADTEAELLCGIRNATLYSLGAALLQIGHWAALDMTDVVAVRKAGAKPSRLGPRYDELTERCLSCDFGYGADLSKPQLQNAVYGSVIHELEEMVALFEGGSRGGSYR